MSISPELASCASLSFHPDALRERFLNSEAVWRKFLITTHSRPGIACLTDPSCKIYCSHCQHYICPPMPISPRFRYNLKRLMRIGRTLSLSAFDRELGNRQIDRRCLLHGNIVHSDIAQDDIVQSNVVRRSIGFERQGLRHGRGHRGRAETTRWRLVQRQRRGRTRGNLPEGERLQGLFPVGGGSMHAAIPLPEEKPEIG